MTQQNKMFKNLRFRYADRFVATYSIVARDPETGEMGVAVQSHWFAVGTLAPWAEAGVGAIATQALANPMFGQQGLELMKQEKNAKETLEELLAEDEGRDFRQVAVIDTNGHVSAWTGRKCVPEAGHVTGPNFSVQANLMLSDTVWPVMAETFQNSSGRLADRMLAALEAAQEARGDIRGKQSAAMLVVKKETTGKRWKDRLIDLRVDDHPAPLQELKRLLTLHEAYEHMNAGDQAIECDDVVGALREYQAAQDLFPQNLEMKYWHAVALANAGRLDEALPIFQSVFTQDNNWKILTPRLLPNEMLNVKEAELAQILT